jgi:pimeloyl-ACP methyl ester carboxylesterase
VTGMLDLMASRTSFVETARGIKKPILVVYGAATPTRSKAEMLALVGLPHVRSVELPFGKLAVHEEFPDAVAEAVRSFLGGLGSKLRASGEDAVKGPKAERQHRH